MEKKYTVSLDLVVNESQLEAVEGFLNVLLSSIEVEEYEEDE